MKHYTQKRSINFEDEPEEYYLPLDSFLIPRPKINNLILIFINHRNYNSLKLWKSFENSNLFPIHGLMKNNFCSEVSI